MRQLILLFGAILIFASCEENPIGIDPDPPFDPTPVISECDSDMLIRAEADAQAQAVQDFGITLFQEVVREEMEVNTVVSPLSVYTALLLAKEGSNCETRNQIIKTLALGTGTEDVETSLDYSTFLNEILPADENVTFTYANALFSDPTRVLIYDSYSDEIEQGYDVQGYETNFSETTALDAINGWAEENTNGKIKKVLDEIEADEIAFLLNAIYYSGDWMNGFEEILTTDLPFVLKNGTSIYVPTMKRDANCTYFKDEEYRLVDLNIKGDEYAVSFLNASDETDINDILFNDNFLENYFFMLENLQTDRQKLTLPKFELEGKLKLKDMLINMGMIDAFQDDLADFTKLGNAGGNIYLTRVLHDTYVKVDEKGIEGAAVTTVGIGAESIPPVLDFNKPFIFVLRHKATGVPIFIGKVENPLE